MLLLFFILFLITGQGLRQRHAYSLLALGEVDGLVDNNKNKYDKKIKFVILRNPWGFGEWTGEWSDIDGKRQNEENNKQMLEAFRTFEMEGLKKQAHKTNYTYKAYNKEEMDEKLNEKYNDEIPPEVERYFDDDDDEDVIKIFKVDRETESIINHIDSVNWQSVLACDKNDGTFMMTYDDFKANFTHLFRCIKFPERWDGRRIAGNWTQDTAGGNYKKKTWPQNPCYTLKVYEDTNFFMSLSGSDPRMEFGKDYNLHSHPFGFHICKYAMNTKGPVNPSK